MARRRDAELVKDIREAIGRISRYIEDVSYAAFLEDTKTQDAVVRNLEVIGEAVRGLSEEFRQQHADLNWKAMAGMRDRLIHHYFGVNWDVVWDVIQQKLPELREALGSAIQRDDSGV